MRKAWFAATLIAVLALLAWWLARADRGAAARQPIAVSPPGRQLAAAPAELALATPEDAPARARVAVEREDARERGDGSDALLRIRVTAGETGEPLAGIPLLLTAIGKDVPVEKSRASRGRLDQEIVTDEHGRGEIVAPAARDYVLLVNWDDVLPVESKLVDLEPLEPGEERALAVEIRSGPDVVWCGRVVDAESLAPLPGAHYARGDGDPFDSEPGTLPVGADGGVCEEVSTWREGFLRFDGEGYWPAIVVPRGGHEQPGYAENVLLWRAAALDLRLDARGAPMSLLARASASRWELTALQGTDVLDLSHGAGDVRWNASQVSAGHLRFEALPPRVPLALQVLADGVAVRRESLVLSPGERRELSLAIEPGCTVGGRTLDPEGRPRAKVALWLAPRTDPFSRQFEPYERDEIHATTTSDEQGRFAFDAVPPGEWRLGPAPPAKRRKAVAESEPVAPLAVEVTVPAAERLVVVDVTCWSGLAIRGRVLGADGRPVAPARVSASSPEFFCTASTGAGGRFELGPLVPGEFQVQARSHRGHAPSARVTARPGDEVELCLTAGGTIKVVVRDPTGHPLPGAEIELVPASGDWRHYGVANERPTEFGGLAPGAYVVHGSNDDSAGWIEVVVTPGIRTEERTLTLLPAARVSVRGPANEMLRVMSAGRLLRLGSLDPLGESTLVVPEGEYELELARWEDGAFERVEARSVRVTIGGENLVEFARSMPPR